MRIEGCSLARTGIILAGGKSSRMGQNKALMKVDGVTVIERISSELSKVTDQLLIVTNTFREYDFLQIPMVEDDHKGKGPMAGIQAGLKASLTEQNLIVACDMPFVSASLGECLLQELEEYQAAIPRLAGRIHPLFGAYRKDVLPVVTLLLENNHLRIQSLLHELHTKIATEDMLHNVHLNNKAVFNMNDRNDYEQALRMGHE